MDNREELLLKHGWVVTCESPFEIESSDGSVATMNAAYSIYNDILHTEKLHVLADYRDSYERGDISKDEFVHHTIDILNN